MGAPPLSLSLCVKCLYKLLPEPHASLDTTYVFCKRLGGYRPAVHIRDSASVPAMNLRTGHAVDSTPRSSSHRKHHGISNPFDQCNINSLVVISLPCNKRASMHTGWSIVLNNLRPVWALCHSGRACTDAHAQRRSLHTSSTDRMDTNCSVARIRVSLAISSTPLQLLQLARF